MTGLAEYYSDAYKGRLDAEQAVPFLARAELILDEITSGRAKDAVGNPEFSAKIFTTICEIAEIIASSDEERPPVGVASETVGAHSITYADGADGGESSIFRQCLRVARKYLGSTGLLYRGCC